MMRDFTKYAIGAVAGAVIASTFAAYSATVQDHPCLHDGSGCVVFGDPPSDPLVQGLHDHMPTPLVGQDMQQLAPPTLPYDPYMSVPVLPLAQEGAFILGDRSPSGKIIPIRTDEDGYVIPSPVTGIQIDAQGRIKCSPQQ
jgi:hypothetical protein